MPSLRGSPGRVVVALACTALLFSACGKGGRKPVYPVHGQVFDAAGKPAAGALVIFYPADTMDAAKPVGHVDAKGGFTLTTYVQGDGAPEGEYVATVEWRPVRTNPFDANRDGADRLQGRFSDPKTSRFRFKIEPGA